MSKSTYIHSALCMVLILSLAVPIRSQPTTRPMPFLAGHVVSADGQPVAGALVMVYDMYIAQDNTPPFAKATTDGQGLFKLACPAVSFSLFVQAAGFGLFASTPVPTLGDDRIEITLRPGTKIRMSVLDPDGQPQAGVRIAPDSMRGPRGNVVLPIQLNQQLSRITGPDGMCDFPDMPRDSSVFFQFPGVARQTGRSTATDDTDIVNADPLQLKANPPGSVTIEGSVVRADTGEPVTDLWVQDSIQYAPNSITGAAAMTGPDGRFRIMGAPAGEHELMPDLTAALSRDFAALSAKLTVTENQQAKDVQIKLARGLRLHGRVSSTSGSPIESARIDFYHKPAGVGFSRARSAADGTYTISLPPGQYTVYVHDLLRSGFLLPDDYMRTVTLDDAHSDVTLDFECKPHPAPWVKGRVVDEEGKAVAGAEVVTRYVEPVEIGNIGFAQPRIREIAEGSARTNADGNFLVPYVSNGARLTVNKGDARLSEPIIVGANNREFSITLPKPSTGSLLVHAIDDGGQPVAGADVILRWFDGDSQNQRTGTTAADGTYLADGLFTHFKYRADVSRKGYTSANASNLVIESGKENDSARLRMLEADSFIAGTVIDADGKPIAGALVRGRGGQNPTLNPTSATTDAAGHFRLEGIIPGTVVGITIYPAGAMNVSQRVQTVSAGTDNAVITFQPIQPGSRGLRGDRGAGAR